ncbi:MAG TPA: universal stress protein [Polyangia bacterium]|nr:universal stress protein [Polyangia bacterium]
MKILWATDFSPRAHGAGQIAGELARMTGGSVEVVHVLAPRTADLLAIAADVGVLDEEIARSVEARTAAEARALVETGVSATAWVGDGDVEAILVARAADTAADLIVLGGNARTVLGRLVLGSGADRTIRRADRPVLIVPEGVTSIAAEGGGLRVLAALDGRSVGHATLQMLRALRQQACCDVTFLRLYWPPEEYDRLGLEGPRDFLSSDPAIVGDLQRHLAAEVGALPGTGRTSFAVEASWGDPARRILEVAGERKAGLLVMGAESRRGLARLSHPAVAENVAKHAAVPVLFVPSRPEPSTGQTVPSIFTVLAATDLSDAGNRAVPFAYTLFGAHGGVVELCYVHERPLPTPAYAYDQPQGKLSAADRASLEARLRALIPPEANRLGITTHVTVVDGGKAGVALVQAAERLWADALVVGSHGRGGATRALLGSVSDEVVRRAGRPVFVVPAALTGS